MQYTIEKLIGTDDNYVIMQVKRDDKSLIVNIEQYVDEDDEIENFFNVNDIVDGQLVVDEVKSEVVNSQELFLDQSIYKFSTFSRLSCVIEKQLDKNKFLAKTVDDVEFVLYAKSKNDYKIDSYYIIEGHFWLFRGEDLVWEIVEEIKKLSRGTKFTIRPFLEKYNVEHKDFLRVSTTIIGEVREFVKGDDSDDSIIGLPYNYKYIRK